MNSFNIQDIKSEFLVEDYLGNFSRHATLFPAVAGALKSFQNQRIKLGIITNGREDLQSSVIHSCGLNEMMDIILISEAEGIKKPEPAIFRSALDRLSLKPSSCIFVGDNPEADIKGAYNAGMLTIWKENDWFDPPDTSVVSFIFNDFRELPEIINNIKHTA